MYCIFHLPRCGSHYVHSLIKSCLILNNPIHLQDEDEPFNPAHNTEYSIQKKYRMMCNRTPKPVVKMVINHYPWLAENFLQDQDYTTIFIKPKNYKKRVLKALVEKQLGTFSNGSDRKHSREKFLGTLEFSYAEIEERFQHYVIHTQYEFKCDVVVEDEEVFTNPKQFMNQLGLQYAGAKYKRIPPYHADEVMMKNLEKFNDMYDATSMKILGRIL